MTRVCRRGSRRAIVLRIGDLGNVERVVDARKKTAEQISTARFERNPLRAFFLEVVRERDGGEEYGRGRHCLARRGQPADAFVDDSSESPQ